jgi:hypothetical protein
MTMTIIRIIMRAIIRISLMTIIGISMTIIGISMTMIGISMTIVGTIMRCSLSLCSGFSFGLRLCLWFSSRCSLDSWGSSKGLFSCCWRSSS